MRKKYFIQFTVCFLLLVCSQSIFASIYNKEASIVVNYKITNLPKNKEDIKVELVAYKGKDTQLMASSIIGVGKNSCVLTINKEFHSGIMDIKVGSYVSSIVVLDKTTSLNVEDSIESLAANKVNLFNDDQKALAVFKEAYMKLNEQNTLSKETYQANLNNTPTSSEPYLNYLKELYIARLKMNQEIQNIQNNFPNTFVASATKDFMRFAELEKNEKLNYTFFHNNYFKNWNFKNQDIIYTPMVTFELMNYLNVFGATKNSNKWYEGIDVFFNTVNKSFDPNIKDFFSEYLIVEFMQSKNPDAEEYMQYIYNNFIAGCSEALQKDRFMKSLANIQSVKEGVKAPDINILDKNKNNRNLYSSLNQYTMVFLWKPHCPYCEELLPIIKEIAKKHNKNLTVFAVSLDKDEAEWQQMIKSNQVMKNWIDVSDHKGFDSPSLTNYFYKATPTIFLLNKDGIIVSKSVEPEVLEDIIQKT